MTLTFNLLCFLLAKRLGFLSAQQGRRRPAGQALQSRDLFLKHASVHASPHFL